MDFDIHMRGLDTLMATPQRDYADVDAGLEQVCTGRVSYGMRVDLFIAETWTIGTGGGLFQNVVHAISRQPLASGTGKRKRGRGALQFAKQEINMTKIIAAATAGLCALALSLGAYAASDEYKAAKKQAEADYKMAKVECKKHSGTEMKHCMKTAEADHEAREDKLKAMK